MIGNTCYDVNSGVVCVLGNIVVCLWELQPLDSIFL